MKKITGILFVMVIVVGVLSTSGCTEDGEWMGVFSPPSDAGWEKSDANVSTQTGAIDEEDAKKIALARVKKRMAEASSELSSQVTTSWLGEPEQELTSYVFHVHHTGVGADVPDFDVYVHALTREVTDNLPSDWAKDLHTGSMD